MKKFFLWLSQGANMAFYGGDPDESVSARAYRQANVYFWQKRLQLIDEWLGLGHCKRSYDALQERHKQRNRYGNLIHPQARNLHDD